MSAVSTDFRTPVMIMIDVSWNEASGAARSERARMEDKSIGGACIRIKTPISTGSRVRVQWRFDQFSAIVKYCRSDAGEYLVGLQRVAANASGALNEVAVHKVASAAHVKNIPGDEPVPSTINPGTESAASTDKLELPLRVDRHQAAEPKAASAVLSPSVQGSLKQPKVRDRSFLSKKGTVKERKTMAQKWLGRAPWQTKHDHAGATDHERSNGKGEDENALPAAPETTRERNLNSRPEVPIFQVELLPMEEIYRGAGLMNPCKGYSVKQIADMLNSDHIRGLAKETKRAAMLMALDAAGTSIEQVEREAKARQAALNDYETEQQKQAENEWKRRAEEITRIQAELESIKAHYSARISRNLEMVAREKATFAAWQMTKRQEEQSTAQVLEFCVKSPPADIHKAPEMRVATSAGSPLTGVNVM